MSVSRVSQKRNDLLVMACIKMVSAQSFNRPSATVRAGIVHAYLIARYLGFQECNRVDQNGLDQSELA